FPPLLRARRKRPRRRAADERGELATLHVWMAPAQQEIIWRAAQRSLAVMCPACWCSPGGLLALIGSANRGLIIRAGSMSPVTSSSALGLVQQGLKRLYPHENPSLMRVRTMISPSST